VIVKLAIVIFISIAGFAFGADPKTNTTTEPQVAEPQVAEPQAAAPETGDLRRLDSVTWDLKTHTLSWVVQHGREENGEFVPTTAKHYQITPDDATMGAARERRPVDEDEAKLVHQLLDTLSIYCARSVVWWEHTAEPSDPSNPDAAPTFKPDRPSKQNEEPTAKPAPVKPVKIAPLLVGEALKALPR
jgi:hypothetical protein